MPKKDELLEKTAREARMVEKAFFDQYLLSLADGISPAALVFGLALAFARIAGKPENLRVLAESALTVLEQRKAHPFTTPRDPMIRRANLRKAI